MKTELLLVLVQQMVKAKLIKSRKFNQSGFSLIEILVAMFLMTMVFTFVTSFNFTKRQALEEGLNKLERAVRFGTGEAAIRNVMVRMHFLLDKEEQEWALEYGPNDRFVLPAKNEASAVTTLKDEEEEDSAQKKMNSQFNKLQEFANANETFPYGVRVVSVSSGTDEKPVEEGEPSLFLYPTGEKDDGFIVLGNEDEVVALEIAAFSPDIRRKYLTLPEGNDEDLRERQTRAGMELFEEWKKSINP